MTAILKVDTIQDTAGNNIINENANTITIGKAGNTTNIVGTLQNDGAALVTGKVLQVVSARTGTQVTSNTTTYIDTGLTASITPSSTSSKILVMIQQSFAKYSGDTYGNFRVYRDSTEIGGTIPFREVGDTDSAAKNVVGTGFSCSILDTPSSTSSLTYKTQFNNGLGVGTAAVQYGSGNSYITLMEIAG